MEWRAHEAKEESIKGGTDRLQRMRIFFFLSPLSHPVLALVVTIDVAFLWTVVH